MARDFDNRLPISLQVVSRFCKRFLGAVFSWQFSTDSGHRDRKQWFLRPVTETAHNLWLLLLDTISSSVLEFASVPSVSQWILTKNHYACFTMLVERSVRRRYVVGTSSPLIVTDKSIMSLAVSSCLYTTFFISVYQMEETGISSVSIVHVQPLFTSWWYL